MMATELVPVTMGDRTPNGRAMVIRHPVCLTITQGGDMPTDVAQNDPGVRDRRLLTRNRDTSGVFGGLGLGESVALRRKDALYSCWKHISIYNPGEWMAGAP